MTRAWPTVPFTRRRMRITQNQAIASRRTFCSVVRFSSGLAGLVFLAFLRHRDWAIGLYWCGIFHARFLEQLAVRAAFANFKLHEVGGIVARRTRRTKLSF